ncbi:MAG TPA: GYF domain-containing protein [Gemmataceae bacterium]|nr:GYF domain-containing protein [Gemmataceae bacterium]
MNVQWYYATGDTRQGPFSGEELQALAAAGKIQPGDTVWKEGMARGVPAHRVKHLFAEDAAAGVSNLAAAASAIDHPPATETVAAHESVREPQAAAETIATERTAAAEGAPEASALSPSPDPQEKEHAKQPAQAPDNIDAPEEQQAAPAPKAPVQQPPPRQGRATAVRGAVIVSQDGTTVYFRKKCSQCGHEETGRSRLPIRNGVTRAGYFCPKCRKLRPVEIQGMT